jgi:hypothetical protein
MLRILEQHAVRLVGSAAAIMGRHYLTADSNSMTNVYQLSVRILQPIDENTKAHPTSSCVIH